MLPKHEIGAIVEQFYFGEADGAKLVHELPTFAPTIHEKEFCKVWESDEKKHEVLFAAILDEYNINRDSAKQSPLFDGIFKIAWQCVEEKDWVKCMTISAVIENIALEAGHYIHEVGDKPVQEVIDQILPDETKHLAFSNQQLKLHATNGTKETNKKAKKKIQQVLKKVKLLGFRLGKQNLFTTHDRIVANRAEVRFLEQLKTMGITHQHIENKNGYIRNSFAQVLLRICTQILF
jgi:1,2-phenylacetyl-CoA epoxidase catalytic subunit